MTKRATEATRRRVALPVLLALVGGAFVGGALDVVSPSPVDAAGETIISTFYVPLFEDNARAALVSVNGGTGTSLSSTTSVTVGADGAIIYYDQWEDGYEAAANVKVQASTLVFGDGNTGNGNAATYCVPARCAGDLLPAGAVLRLNNSATVVPGSIVTPRTTGVVVFDGRDKLSSTDGLAVTHATWPTAIDALHSEMAAAFDTSRWGVNFSAPVGVNTPAQGAGTTSFSYTGMEVMAREAGTLVYIDTNNDGDYLDVGDHNGTSIGEGQTVYVNGNVREGAKVVTSKPAQVFLMTGVIGSNYENRSFQVFPTEGLVNDYVAPASSARPSGSPSYATVLYLFNPQPTPITVNVQTATTSVNYTIGAGVSLNPAPVLPTGEGARVTSASTFAAVAGIGTLETSGNSLNYDWGYSLLPARVITDSLVVGWAPGSQNLSVAGYDPVWVTATAPTTIFVDYDADPATGANVDPNGSRYDVAIPLATALTQLRITDAGDRDMTGARIYTVDGTAVAAAYGEDPAATTPVAFPGIDLGTTLFPACGALCIRKLATISVDVDGDGLADPGDTLRWSVEAANTDYYTLINPIMFDTLPTGVAYVPGSTTIVINGDPPIAVADDVVPPAASLFPYDESGRQITANIPVGGVVTAYFETTIDADFAGTDAICNRAIVTSQREIILTPANGADTGCIPVDGLRITKVSDSGGNPVMPGGDLNYTIVVTNTSGETITNVAVADPLPAGLTWVSTDVTRPADVTTTTTTSTTNTVADNMETAGSYTGSSGTQAWTSNWAETDTNGGGGGGGLVQEITDLGDRSISFRPTAENNDAITRTAGNFGTATSVTLAVETRCLSMETGDVVTLQVRPTAAAAWVTLETFLNCNDAAYVPHTYTLTSGTHYGTATAMRFIVTDAFSNGGGDEFFFDNVQFNVTTTTTTTTTTREIDTVPGAAPPNLVTLTDLLAGETATIVVATTVDDPYTATDEITNIATVRTGNQVAKATMVDCVRCFDFGDDPASYNGAGGTNPARARATSARLIIADTFQNLGYNGSSGTAPWAGATWLETEGGGAGPTAGLVQNVVDVSTRSIRVGSPTITTPAGTLFSRVVGDLSGFTTVNLGYDYRCSNLGATDTIELQIRPDAAASWVTKQIFNSCNNATIYSSADLTLAPGEYGTATEIRLNVTDAFEANELFFFDDVQIRGVADAITVGPRLGSAFDREVSGLSGAAPSPATPPAAPTGDDSASDDEDGVTVPAVDVNTMDIPIVVTDADGGVSYVNGWLDWNNDGDFDADESLFDGASFVSATGGLTVSGGAGQVPGPGTYTVTINVPNLETNGSGYAIGNTVYSRFRVATQLSGVTSAVGASLDGEVEDYSTVLNTLPVTVAHFGSQRVGNDVAVQWRTAQEVDNLGFRVYAEEADGTLTLLHDELVVSKSPTSIESQEYELDVRTDAALLWLEDESLDGVTELHGPYVIGESVGDPEPPPAIDWTPTRREAAQRAATERRASLTRARAESRARRAAPESIVAGPVARLDVTTSGIQQVTYEQLLVVGVDLAGVPAATLAITDREGPVPIEVLGAATFGPGSSIRFLGEPLDTLYTDTNVYRLHLDASLARRVTVLDPNAPAPTTTTTSTVPRTPSTTLIPPRRTEDVRPTRTTTTTTPATVAPTTTTPVDVVPVTDYTATAVAEVNAQYSLTAPGADPWFEQMLVTMAGSPATAGSSVTLTSPVAGEPGHAAVELWGITRSDIPDEHHVRLRVNGVEIADAHFDDNDALRLEGSVPAGVLVDGVNTLDVTLLDDTGVAIGIVVVDRWEVTYQRSTVAEDGRLDLTVGAPRLDVTGFPAGGIIAYRLEADGSITRVVTADSGAVVQVPGSATSQRYVLSAPGAVLTPALAPLHLPTGLATGSADYLIITNGIFTETLAPLVAYHESQGRVVKVVDVNAVYEAYGHGVVDAAAIDAYLAQAVPALGVRWVLLVGADSVDYRDYDDDGSLSLLPSLYGSTGFTVTYAPIDPAYADVDGDGVPDVALGRFPARTTDELTTMIAKTLAYANQVSTNSVLLVSDTADGIDFAGENDGLATTFDGWNVFRADPDVQGADPARAELLARLDDGMSVTMYVGHSGSQEWTELGLFNAADAAGLSNESPTVVVQFGCWNTYYVAPSADTMAHALLLNPTGGAAAVLGSSTLASSGNDIALAGYLATELADGTLTVGEAVLAAKHELQLHAGGATADAQLGWTILGDPALPVGGNG